jgi:hypothetical protein
MPASSPNLPWWSGFHEAKAQACDLGTIEVNWLCPLLLLGNTV